MLSFVIQYTPHIITSAAVFSAILCHWLWPKRFWKPSLFSAALASVVAYVLFALLPRENDDTLVQESLYLGEAIAFAFISSFVVAMLVGCLMKFTPSLFKD